LVVVYLLVDSTPLAEHHVVVVSYQQSLLEVGDDHCPGCRYAEKRFLWVWSSQFLVEAARNTLSAYLLLAIIGSFEGNYASRNWGMAVFGNVQDSKQNSEPWAGFGDQL